MKHKGFSRQGSLYVVIALCAAAAAVFLPRLWSQARGQACAESRGTFRENFDDTNYKDAANSAIAQWPAGPITLPRKGANFAMTQPGAMGARIYVCASGDFNGDGYPDLVGLDISGQFAALPYRSRLLLIRNQYATHGAALPFFVDISMVFDEFHVNTGPASITAGDYNGDGLLDFFFMRNSADEFGYTNFLAAMYINVGTRFAPQFRRHNQSPNIDFTSRFQTARIYINWAADHLCSADIDKDGDVDLLAISQDRIYLIRNPGPANFNLAAFEIGELPYDRRTGFTVGRGGSCVTAADFDNDGDIDVVGGTVNNIPYLVYYENDGLGHFTRKELAIPDPRCTGSVGALGVDFTNDGWADIFVATDRWNAGNEARMWFMRNMGLKSTTIINAEGVGETVTEVDWLFTCLNNCNPIIPPSYDVDMSTPIDYDQDGDIDIVIADANHSGDYYLVVNQLAEVFVLYGQAQSTNVVQGTIDPRLHAITQARVSRIVQGVRGPSSNGLAVALYFSNNGGNSWEFYRRFQSAEIRSVSGLPWHDFNTFGADFRWRAVLTANEDPMAEHTGASFETPWIDIIELEYTYVGRHEYSRTSAAATIVTREGLNKKLVIGSSFIFPGWEGQLRAYDVSAVSFTSDPYSALAVLTSSDLASDTGRSLEMGTEIYWDAGRLLNDRHHDSRTVYTAIRAGNDLVRTDFTRSNAAALAWFLQDVNNDAQGLIDFVRGKGRYWKLGDINHSTPVVVGPPSEDPAYMGAGYAEFRETYRDRAKVIYVGANDGMLHCFDASTGEELWGFIPYNLLSKLRNMWKVDRANNTRFFARDIYVDGSPSVADVQINGQWRTVLVCGQGPGRGSTPEGGLNYYWALDITDPGDPRPLWEISHIVRSGNRNNLTMGETWSVPAIGKVRDNNLWVAFMGSGYDNDPAADLAGTYFYAVRIDDGRVIWNWQISTQVDTARLTGARRPYRYTNIAAAIPGSPTAVDVSLNGYIDSVFFGDLDGRLYRLDVTGSRTNNWSVRAIYTDYLYYPIITKPAVWMDPYAGNPVPRIFIGTGGHERGLGTYAPNDDELAAREFSFVALVDHGRNDATVEWYMGNPTLLAQSADLRTGELGVGSKVWADPVVANGIVYFSTLRGSIEAVNPCVNLGEAGRLYARYIRMTSSIPAGGTAFKSAEPTPPEYLDLVSKARRAVTVGEAQSIGGRVSKREVYVQEYDSTIEVLQQPIGSLLRIKSWREIYRIIW